MLLRNKDKGLNGVFLFYIILHATITVMAIKLFFQIP